MVNKWLCHLFNGLSISISIGKKMLCVLINQNVATCITFLSIVVPPGVKWMNHIHLTGSCVALALCYETGN